MKKPLILFIFLLCSISFSQVTNYYDANGRKIGSSKVVSTPESTLDKMIDEQRQQMQSVDLNEGNRIIEQKLKEYETRQNLERLNEKSEVFQQRIQIIRDLGKKGCSEARQQLLLWKPNLNSQELQILENTLPYGCYL